jgi:hypothetical protein
VDAGAGVNKKAIVIPFLCGLAALVLVAYCYGRSRDAAVERARAAGQRALARADSLQLVADSLQELEGRLRAASGRVRLRIDTVRTKAETLLVRGDTAAAVPLLRAAVSSCRQALALADAATTACDARAALQGQRADSLAGALRLALRALRPRHWGCTVGLGAVEGLGHGLGVAAVCGRHF